MKSNDSKIASLWHMPALLIIICVVIVSCGSDAGNGGSGNGGNGGGQSTNPEVTTTWPLANATDVYAIQQVSVTFSKDMDASTITTDFSGGSFVLKNSNGDLMPGVISYDDETRTATFTPIMSLAVPETYTATVTSAVTDEDGHALAEDYLWSFTTTGFYFIVLSDTHVRIPGNPDDAFYNNQQNLDNLEETISTINDFYSDAAFVVVTGDLVGCLFSEDPDDYVIGGDNPAERFKSMMDELAMPYYSALGNHDYMKGFDAVDGEGWTTDNIMAIESVWNKVLGINPYYSFEYEGIDFIILNSNRGNARSVVCPYSEHEAFCIGSFDDTQMNWLVDKLSESEYALLFFHHPLHTDTASILWSVFGDSFLVVDNDRIYDITESHVSTIKGIFVGHGHIKEYDTLWNLIDVNETAATGGYFSEANNINLVGLWRLVSCRNLTPR
ncbi:MAG: Ig-like domain-containing protein [Pseudomonadota bacterium]